MEISAATECMALRQMAKKFRTSAANTDLAAYSIKMNNAANDLDVRALQIETAGANSQAALGR
jgi:hypothetical protein